MKIMFKKISIRSRLTILSALLLIICCLGLTAMLNFSAFQLADRIDATIIMPAAETVPSQNQDGKSENLIPLVPSEDTVAAKKVFSLQSIISMLIIIIGGSVITYYISGKVLKPLKILNSQVKNININNLSESLDVPPTKDEISELTESFNLMTDKLNEAFITQRRFSTSAAHELRTPLAVLQTKIDVFKKKSVHNNEEYEALIAVFDKQISRLRSLIKNLLDMTNMDDQIEQTEIPLNDLFEDILSELSLMAKEKNIFLSYAGNDINIYGNIDLLYRAFYNLVENGIKYNKDGGFVKIEAIKVTGNTVIRITDSGIGIPDEMKKNIFEPFYRVDKSRSREMGGAGLGLAMVNAIIKKHGGSIEVENAVNEGSCFIIRCK